MANKARRVKIDPKKDGAIQRMVNPVATAKRKVDVIAPKLSKAVRALDVDRPGEE